MEDKRNPYLAAPGIVDIKKMQSRGLYPTEERIKRGPIAVLECTEEIPCNPCEGACKKGCITIGHDITSLPVVDEKCSGCGICLPACPGLAIFVLDGSLPDGMAAVTVPYELYPPPAEQEKVFALDRYGNRLVEGEIIKVRKLCGDDGCLSVTFTIPFRFIHRARHFIKKGQ